MAKSAQGRDSYVDIFGETLPSRFPIPRPASRRPEVGLIDDEPTSKPLQAPRVPFRKRVRNFFTNVWDSRVAMKLFGSRKELELEEERLQSIEYIVIHPCSKFRYIHCMGSCNC